MDDQNTSQYLTSNIAQPYFWSHFCPKVLYIDCTYFSSRSNFCVLIPLEASSQSQDLKQFHQHPEICRCRHSKCWLIRKLLPEKLVLDNYGPIKLVWPQASLPSIIGCVESQGGTCFNE